MRTRIALVTVLPVFVIAVIAVSVNAGAHTVPVRSTTAIHAPVGRDVASSGGPARTTAEVTHAPRHVIGSTLAAATDYLAASQLAKPAAKQPARSAATTPTTVPAPAPAPVVVAPAPAPAPVPVSDATSTNTGDWACIRVRESGDRYSSSSAPSGAYGIIQQTWQSFGYSGWPYEAPASEQDALALKLYNMYGWAPWSSRYSCGL